MERKDLIELMNEILCPLGFKHKGNNWLFNEAELSKIINLQKSCFGNYYYINYGFIIKAIKLDGLYMHIDNRLASKNREEQKEIDTLLDFEFDMPKKRRLFLLKQKIELIILPVMQNVNSEEDIKNELKKRSHLNNIPLSVKKHFHLL